MSTHDIIVLLSVGGYVAVMLVITAVMCRTEVGDEVTNASDLRNLAGAALVVSVAWPLWLPLWFGWMSLRKVFFPQLRKDYITKAERGRRESEALADMLDQTALVAEEMSTQPGMPPEVSAMEATNAAEYRLRAAALRSAPTPQRRARPHPFLPVPE